MSRQLSGHPGTSARCRPGRWSSGVRHPERREEALLREVDDRRAGAPAARLAATSGSPSCCTPRPCPAASACVRPIANAVRSALGAAARSRCARLHSRPESLLKQVTDLHRVGRCALPLGDPRGRAIVDVEVSVVLGDADQRARDRLRHREDVLRRLGVRAAEVPLAGDLAVAHDHEAVRLPGLGRRRDLLRARQGRGRRTRARRRPIPRRVRARSSWWSSAPPCSTKRAPVALSSSPEHAAPTTSATTRREREGCRPTTRTADHGRP